MNVKEGRQDWLRLLLLFVPPFLAGTAVRLFDILRQIPLDDEWHSLNFVIDRTLWGCFGWMGAGANCVPQNIYNRFLLDTVGWSELLLRLPSLLCGVLSLVVFPAAVRRLRNDHTAFIFAWFLALSPCLTFYSRIMRPYSMAFFFGFSALLCFLFWVRSGKKQYMLLYAFSAFSAVYFHLFAAITALTPLLCLFIFIMVERFTKFKTGERSLPAFSSLLWPAGIVGGLGAVLILPPLLSNPWWMNAMGKDGASMGTVLKFLTILAGTHAPLLVALFAILAVAGLVLLLRDDRRTGLVFGAVTVLFILFVSVSTQDGMNAAIQVARYGISIFPVWILLVSIGLSGLFELGVMRRVPPYGRFAFYILLLAGFAWTSPLRRIYGEHSSFLNHSAYQDSYEPHDWSKSRARDLFPDLPQKTKGDIPPFYFQDSLLAGSEGIIEYPMFIGDHWNGYYYYQHFHGKSVAAGCIPELKPPKLRSHENYVYGSTMIDYVMSRLYQKYPEKVGFRNIVPVTHIPFIRSRYAGWLIAVHKDPYREMYPVELEELSRLYENTCTIFTDFLRRELGRPLYETDRLAVWRISSGG